MIEGDAFYNLGNVEIINLSNNNIQTIKKNAFHKLPLLYELMLSNNPSSYELRTITKECKDLVIPKYNKKSKSSSELFQTKSSKKAILRGEFHNDNNDNIDNFF